MDLSAEESIADRHFYDLPQLLEEGDVLVFNDTKVIPARLYGTRGEALVEVTLYHPVDGIRWWSFIKNAKRLKPNDVIRFYTSDISPEKSDFTAVVLEKKDEDGVLISFACPPSELGKKLEQYGFMPFRRTSNGKNRGPVCGINLTIKKTTRPFMPNTKVP